MLLSDSFDVLYGKLVKILDYLEYRVMVTQTEVRVLTDSLTNSRQGNPLFTIASLDADLNARSITDAIVVDKRLLLFVKPGILVVTEIVNDDSSLSFDQESEDFFSVQLEALVKLPFRSAFFTRKSRSHIAVTQSNPQLSLVLNLNDLSRVPIPLESFILCTSETLLGSVSVTNSQIEMCEFRGDKLSASTHQQETVVAVAGPVEYENVLRAVLLTQSVITVFRGVSEWSQSTHGLENVLHIAMIDDALIIDTVNSVHMFNILPNGCVRRMKSIHVSGFEFSAMWIAGLQVFICTSQAKYLRFDLMRIFEGVLVDARRIKAMDGSLSLKVRGENVSAAAGDAEGMAWTEGGVLRFKGASDNPIREIEFGGDIVMELFSLSDGHFLAHLSTGHLQIVTEAGLIRNEKRVILESCYRCGPESFVGLWQERVYLVSAKEKSIAILQSWVYTPSGTTNFALLNSVLCFSRHPIFVDTLFSLIIVFDGDFRLFDIRGEAVADDGEFKLLDIATQNPVADLRAIPHIHHVVQANNGALTLLTLSGKLAQKSIVSPDLLRKINQENQRSLKGISSSSWFEVLAKLVDSCHEPIKTKSVDFRIFQSLHDFLPGQVFYPAIIEGLRSGCPLTLYPFAARIFGNPVPDVWKFCIEHGLLQSASNLLVVIQDSVGPEAVRTQFAKSLIVSATQHPDIDLLGDMLEFLYSDQIVANQVVADIVNTMAHEKAWLDLAIFVRTWSRVSKLAETSLTVQSSFSEKDVGSFTKFGFDETPELCEILISVFVTCGLEVERSALENLF